MIITILIFLIVESFLCFVSSLLLFEFFLVVNICVFDVLEIKNSLLNHIILVYIRASHLVWVLRAISLLIYLQRVLGRSR